MNTLITAATSLQAHKLKRFLEINEGIVLADQADLPEFMRSERRYIRISSPDSPSFAHEMLRRCLDYDIQAVFPLRKKEIYALAEARPLFEEFNIRIYVPAKNVLDNLFAQAPAKGSLMILYRGELIKKEDADRQFTLPKGVDSGVFVIDSKNILPTCRIFTAD